MFFIRCIADTMFGELDFLHTYEQVPEEQRDKIKVGSVISGYCRLQGVVDNMSEDISGTPKGFYSISSAFYRNNMPDTKLDVFEITQDTYWVDDPDSVFYNQRVEGTAQKDWDSAEHMIDYSNYDYGFVIDYNIPVQYNAGSAIFFHVGYNPTAGCVAVSEDMVLQYLSKLDSALNPYILIN